MAAKRKDWQAQVKGLLKAELKRRNLSYADLADKLAAIGIKDNEKHLEQDRARELHGVFSSNVWKAIGCRTVHLDDGS